MRALGPARFTNWPFAVAQFVFASAVPSNNGSQQSCKHCSLFWGFGGPLLLRGFFGGPTYRPIPIKNKNKGNQTTTTATPPPHHRHTTTHHHAPTHTTTTTATATTTPPPPGIPPGLPSGRQWPGRRQAPPKASLKNTKTHMYTHTRTPKKRKYMYAHHSCHIDICIYIYLYR